MGFYGNITNTTRTQFQFDKIYPNRYTMDRNVRSDGIYVGRYVLVEYDQDYKVEDNFIQAYNTDGEIQWDQKNADGDIERVSITKGQLGTFTFDGKTITPIIYIKNKEKIIFYKVTSERVFDNSEEAKKSITIEEETIIDEKASNYGENFAIDEITYGIDRGYDSTVWMKNYVDGEEKYIMIAELNTVVPTFEVYPDAPRLIPKAPHFDKSSTNVYYPLHWQTTWGFRVKQGEEGKSDEQIKRNLNTGELNDTGYKGAIYYNKAGFKKETRSKATGNDYISIEPTGVSGQEYIDHTEGDNTSVNKKTKQPDILELSVMLPSLGNAISDMWDIIYDTDRRLDIEYKYLSSAGQITNEGKTFNLDTLAGCINKFHNILGQNIYKTSSKDIKNNKENFYNNHYICEVDGEYYRIHKEIPYNPDDGAVLGEAGDAQYSIIKIPGFENDVTTIYRLILDIKQLLATDDEELKNTLDRNTIQGCINTINNIIDLYENTYNNSLIVFNNDNNKFSSAEVTGDSWINYKVVDGKNVSFTHTKHDNAIAVSEPETDLTKGEKQLSISVPTFDEAGHVNGQSSTSINLPNTYTSFQTNGKSTETGALSFEEIPGSAIYAATSSDTVLINPANKWVQIKMSDGSVTEKDTKDTIEIAHATSAGGAGTYGDNEENQPDAITVPKVIIDEAGHITTAEDIDITLPYSFSSIVTDAKEIGEEIKETSIEALKPKDALNLFGDNKWINTVSIISKDDKDNYLQKEVRFEHVKSDRENQVSTKVNNTTASFNVPSITYDEAGHIISTDNVSINQVTMASEQAKEATDSKVLIGLSLSDDKKLTPSVTNIGNLKITDYNSDEASGDLSENDTINSAFGKLENRIKAEELVRNELNFTGNAEEGKYVSAVSQTNGKISTTLASLPDYSEYWNKITEMQNTIANLIERIEQLENLVEPTE